MEGYKTIHQLVLAKLREKILNGSYPPGQKLIQEDIASELGVSRMPVREAFRQLEAEGLVVIEPHRGVWVATLSAEEIEELQMIRSMLEGRAAEAGAEKMTPEVLAQMKQVLSALERATDLEELLQLDKEFHLLLYKASGYHHLVTLITSLQDKSDPYLRTYMSCVDQREESLEEHRKLVKACEERDGQAARRITTSTLNRLASKLKSFLKKRNWTRN